MYEEKKESGFVVKDRRIFAEGENAAAENKATAEKPASEEPVQPEDIRKQDEKPAYPPINFTNFILSLSTSALFHFGDFPDPVSGKTQKNLPAAKQTIDMLDMINDKTKGNLTEQENNLMQGVIYELKLRYVKENG